MPPPIHWKWGLRGCDSGQSMVKVSLPTGLLSLTVGADFDQSMEKYSPSHAYIGGDKHRHLLVDNIVLVPGIHRMLIARFGRLKGLFAVLFIIYAKYLQYIITAGVEPNPL